MFVVVFSPWVIGSARLEENTNCTIVLGPCHTSVYLESLTNCTLYITCHQLRIHNCKNCNLYVKVASHPIIEDCEALAFAPYNFTYAGIEEDIKTCHLEQASCWNNVVDFRWHKSIPSPNWKVLEESLRQLPPCGQTKELEKQIQDVTLEEHSQVAPIISNENSQNNQDDEDDEF